MFAIILNYELRAIFKNKLHIQNFSKCKSCFKKFLNFKKVLKKAPVFLCLVMTSCHFYCEDVCWKATSFV